MKKFKYVLLGAVLGIALYIGIGYGMDKLPMVLRSIASSQDVTSGASERPSDTEMYGDFGDTSPEEAAALEDLSASGKINTTLDIDPKDSEWMAKAVEMTQAVSGDTYVQLDSGVLTVNQINNFLKTMPFESTYVDSNNQFLYYNNTKNPEDMFVPRTIEEVGDPLAGSHPDMVHNYVAWVVHQLRTGAEEVIPVAMPTNSDDEFVVHYYRGMYDENGDYQGINQYVVDIKPIVDFYLEKSNQSLVPN
ncbi:PAS domain-containing protein [Fundicoccus culcitae]|uniref:PAS domain-containing protein n=1 Tax=Fundicoccus culcitae TaxID=2969821 RepID=A0ABY5P6V2_9LACT|nr:PAS domain-containing protein [Fundicoccus culcitae]UUX34464.1 PAS domain-containing protein [Fundicoccus culcitae]